MEHQKRSRAVTLAVALAAIVISLANATGTEYQPPNYYRYGGPRFRPPDGSDPCQVDVYFDMNGVTGTISFYQERKDVHPVKITVRLMGLDQFGDDEPLDWHIHEWPINFGLLEFAPCSNEEVGGHFDPHEKGSNVNYTQLCADDPDECEVGDLSGRHGPLSSNISEYCFDDYHLDLYRGFGITGRSVVIHTIADDRRVACANLEYSDGSLVTTYRAPFPHDPLTQDNTLMGDIILKRIEGKAGMTIHAELYRVDGGPATNAENFEWSLRLGDPGSMGDCSDIRHIYGSKTHANDPIHYDYDSKCTPGSQRRCYIGDLTSKCGPLEYEDAFGRIKHFCTDEQLGVVPLEDILKLSIVINETDNSRFLACSNFSLVAPEVATAYFLIDDIGLQGHFYFYQTDPHEPTFVRIHVVGLDGEGGYFQIRDKQCTENDRGLCISCEGLGGVYEPRPDQQYIAPGDSDLTGDQALLGELRYKWESIEGAEEYRTTQRSSYIPLFGPFSIYGHSLVLNMDNGDPWACANIKRLFPVPPYIPSLLGFSNKKKK